MVMCPFSLSDVLMLFSTESIEQWHFVEEIVMNLVERTKTHHTSRVIHKEIVSSLTPPPLIHQPCEQYI